MRQAVFSGQPTDKIRILSAYHPADKRSSRSARGLGTNIAVGKEIMSSNPLSQLSDEMFKFSLLGSLPTILSPRLGQLSLRGGKKLATPHYLPISSRGALPHASHDTIRDNMSVDGLYVALEDCESWQLGRVLV